jgi:hypothetical protein
MRKLHVFLGVCFAVALGVLLAPTHPADAQSVGIGTSDTWSGHDDRTATCSKSISSTASVVAAVTGRRINVRAITMSSSGAGVVVFQDGSGGTTIGNFYLAANTPVTIYENAFGAGMKTTSGNGLFAVLSGATLTAVVRYRAE